MMRRLHPDPRAARGYLLLEVIIAMTVFSITAVGMAVALQSSIDASNRLARDLAIRQGLEAMLVEAQAKPKTKEMAFSRSDDQLRMEFKTEVDPLEFVNAAGEPVAGLWLLRASASPAGSSKDAVENHTAELYVYRP